MTKKMRIFLLVFILVIGLIVVVKGVKQVSKPTIKEIVEKQLPSSKESYGIVIKNLKTDTMYFLNEHKIYQSGSLYKLWIMAEALNQIQKGTLQEDEVLEKDIASLNEEFNIATESAELTEGTITFTVKDALEQMISISHNYAALLLTERIKLSSIASFLKRNGFTESKLGINDEPPITTPFDIALFFEKLYKGELANPQYTKKMISLLKKQQVNDKLPKYLPKEIVIAHKTGELDTFSHDAGIVYTPKEDYIIVILSNTDFPPIAEDQIAKISKAVYDYFMKNPSE